MADHLNQRILKVKSQQFRKNTYLIQSFQSLQLSLSILLYLVYSRSHVIQADLRPHVADDGVELLTLLCPPLKLRDELDEPPLCVYAGMLSL